MRPPSVHHYHIASHLSLVNLADPLRWMITPRAHYRLASALDSCSQDAIRDTQRIQKNNHGVYPSSVTHAALRQAHWPCPSPRPWHGRSVAPPAAASPGNQTVTHSPLKQEVDVRMRWQRSRRCCRARPVIICLLARWDVGC